MCGIVGYIGPKDHSRSSSRACGDSSTAATTRPGSPSSTTTADWNSAGRRASCGTWRRSSSPSPAHGRYGLGHTRWATHGRPSEENAHPHRDCTGKLVVIHNGIIENYLELKHELEKKGHTFVTETDTEIVAHAIEEEMKTAGTGLADSFRAVLGQLRGIYALVALPADAPDTLVAARLGPPLVVGIGDEGEYFVASDIPAILNHTKDMIFMDDDEVVVLTPTAWTS